MNATCHLTLNLRRNPENFYVDFFCDFSMYLLKNSTDLLSKMVTHQLAIPDFQTEVIYKYLPPEYHALDS